MRGVFGVVLGECWANTHPVTFPLYKGVSASWGECCTLLRDYGSPATRLRLVGNEITARRQRDYGSSATRLRLVGNDHSTLPKKEFIGMDGQKIYKCRVCYNIFPKK